MASAVASRSCQPVVSKRTPSIVQFDPGSGRFPSTSIAMLTPQMTMTPTNANLANIVAPASLTAPIARVPEGRDVSTPHSPALQALAA
jgi:hypothetical protein